ncbi:MAG: protein translocase subunit SecD [Micavibrio sp.]|nr:protein translocase subunit SecD [Micavibrio sp.]
MLHFEKWKVILTILLSIIGVAYAVPNVLPPEQLSWAQEHLPDWMPTRTVNLGLDLRGGSHLLAEADTKKVIEERMDTMRLTTRNELVKQNIKNEIKTERNGITVKLLNPADKDAAVSVIHGIDRAATVDASADGIISVSLSDQELNDLKLKIIEQSIEIVRRRVDESGTKEPVIQRQGNDRIVIQLPGVDNPQHIKDLIGPTAQMSFHMVDESATQEGLNNMRLPMRDNPAQSLIVNKRPLVKGDRLTDAQPNFDQSGPVVSFKFDSMGSQQFCKATKENVGRPFAIVLDEKIISAPVIRDSICGGSGQISGGFDVKGANDLALLLRAGALPAPLSFVEERTVGPTLGSDSVNAGKHAAIYAFIFVFIVMAASYGLFGLFANIALALNMIFILAILSILQATLTLPGIAGIILTIGIAVDANVLVYERIREELRQGRTVMSAIDKGYEHAKGTIWDANLTTLIVAVILFSFGTGPVKGFAVSMTIGIITTIFSALLVTRLMIVGWLRKARPATLDL